MSTFQERKTKKVVFVGHELEEKRKQVFRFGWVGREVFMQEAVGIKSKENV